MTEKKDFKKLVRERRAKTGESYTSARMNLLFQDQGASVKLSDDEKEMLVVLYWGQRWVPFGHDVPFEALSRLSGLGARDCAGVLQHSASLGLVKFIQAGVRLQSAGTEAVRDAMVPPSLGRVVEFEGDLSEVQRAVLDMVTEHCLRHDGDGAAVRRDDLRRGLRSRVSGLDGASAGQAIISVADRYLLPVGMGQDPGHTAGLRGLLASEWGRNAVGVIEGTLGLLRTLRPGDRLFTWRSLRDAAGLHHRALNLACLSIALAKLGTGIKLTPDDPIGGWFIPKDLDLLLDKAPTAVGHLRHLLGIGASRVPSETAEHGNASARPAGQEVAPAVVPSLGAKFATASSDGRPRGHRLLRPDETWHRLREWTYGQAPSERLAHQILLSEDYKDLDPSHPLGGPDGGKDAVCSRGGKKWVAAVYFPRGQQLPSAIRQKFLDDLRGVAGNVADGLVFVTNQELTLSERDALKSAAGSMPIELYHLERITSLLDQPVMAPVRKQFLMIDFGAPDLVAGNVPIGSSEAPKLSLRYETKSMDRDAAGTVTAHHYELVARITNSTKKRLDDWYIEVELPTLLLEPHTTYGTLVRERSDAERSIFRTSSKLQAIPCGDPYDWKLPYRVDDKIHWDHAQALERAGAIARAFVDGALVAETVLKEIENF